MDALFLSRLQFALTIMFHYIFPPLTIGLGVLLVILEGAYLKTKNPLYESATKFWIGIFALNFAMGVVTGIVMEFQFGTNWSVYSRYVGDVFGSALAAEGIFAFFLESGFLAILVFGWNRVSPGMHFFATIMVALGSIFSAIWIVVANSWQQTPAGSAAGKTFIANGIEYQRAEITDFWAVVFNPSTVERLVHVWIGAFILGSFFVMSISAYYILHRRHEDFARKSFAAALAFGVITSLAALVSGHSQAKNVHNNQPEKLAAFEGHFHTGPADLYLIGIPNERDQRVDYGLKLPGGVSYLLYKDARQPIDGLDNVPEDERPPVLIPFVSYHIMVGLGTFFIAISLLALFFYLRRTLFQKRWLMWIFVFAVIGPYIANELGWVAAEVGRQPWIVYKQLKTAEAVSPVVDAGQVLASIIMFGLIYLALLAIWIYVLNDKIQKGPESPPLPAGTKDKHGFLDTAARLANHGGDSMTDVRDISDTSDEDQR